MSILIFLCDIWLLRGSGEAPRQAHNLETQVRFLAAQPIKENECHIEKLNRHLRFLKLTLRN